MAGTRPPHANRCGLGLPTPLGTGSRPFRAFVAFFAKWDLPSVFMIGGTDLSGNGRLLTDVIGIGVLTRVFHQDLVDTVLAGIPSFT